MLIRPTGYRTCPKCDELYAVETRCPCDNARYPRWLRLLAWLGMGMFSVLAWAGIILLVW